MMGCGSATFTDPEEFGLNLPGATISIVLTSPGDFKARMTWVTLPHLSLVRCTEHAPRVACMTLAPGSVVVSFPTRHQPPPIWQGVEILLGEIALHGRGEQVFQRTVGDSHWGFISVSPEALANFGGVISGVEPAQPATVKFLRPTRQAVGELLRLHQRACRLAETDPDVVAHREVVRAMEHDLTYALVKCFAGDEAHRDTGARQRRLSVVSRFEDALASQEGDHRPTRGLAALIGAPERLLRTCCAEFLGMPPSRYARLRRLHLVRRALRRADPVASVGAIARQHGFSELGRFAVAYRMIFGEAPSTTLRDSRSNFRKNQNSHSVQH
jgi:AraC-like DNA-binding protein